MSSDLLRPRTKHRRVIDALRAHFPGKWRFENPCYWHHESGWYVVAHAHTHWIGCEISDTSFIVGYAAYGEGRPDSLPFLPNQGKVVRCE